LSEKKKPDDPIDLPPVIRVSPDEVARAVPPPKPVSPFQAQAVPMKVEKPHRTPMATAALVFGILGLAVVLLGPVAIICGVLALAAIHGNPGVLRGTKLAATGVVLGVVGLVGWTGVFFLFLRPAWKEKERQKEADEPRKIHVMDVTPPSEVIENTPEPIRTALKANVYIQGSSASANWSGSGIVIDREGGRVRILTNRHVSDPPGGGGGTLSVLLASGERATAATVWTAPERLDLSILEVVTIQSDGLRPIPLKRRKLAIGTEVFAIGNPSQLPWNYTRGVLSSVRMDGSTKAIQHDAAISAGNSGGGLYSTDGTLIGVNTWTMDKARTEGLNFAISVDTLLDALAGSSLEWAKRLVEASDKP
jgi:S1-C subfamily serine protease